MGLIWLSSYIQIVFHASIILHRALPDGAFWCTAWTGHDWPDQTKPDLHYSSESSITLVLSSMLALAENLLWEGRSQWKRLGAPLRPGFSSVDISRLIWHVFLYCRHFSLTELGWGTPEDWLESRQLLMRQVKPQEVSQICNIRIQVLHMLSCNKGCILGKKYRQAQSHLDLGDDQTPISGRTGLNPDKK